MYIYVYIYIHKYNNIHTLVFDYSYIILFSILQVFAPKNTFWMFAPKETFLVFAHQRIPSGSPPP